MKYQFIITRMAVLKTNTENKCWCGYGAMSVWSCDPLKKKACTL